MSTTLSDLPESKLEQLLTDLGLLGTLTIDGSQLPPLSVQIGQFNPAAIDPDTRICAILASGENNPTDARYFQDYNVTIVISGVSDRTDLINTKMIALEFNKALRSYKDESAQACGKVIGVVTNGHNGPFYEQDGRVIYEVPLRLLIS